MRRSTNRSFALLAHAALLALALTGSARHQARADGTSAAAIPADKRVKLTIDKASVDLNAHVLVASMSRPADHVHLKVTGESGAVLFEGDLPFNGAAAGTPLSCSWTPSSDEAVARIEVFGYAPDGYWSGIAITPWKAEVPHEEVVFDTDSDVIRASESPKLDASLKAIRDMVKKRADLAGVVLYIEGHTDTMGTAEHNFDLSRRRARSIGAWFKAHGLKLPIAFEGVGESIPRVPTADQVDEPKNRRVDYVLSADPLALPSSSSSVTLGWHSL